ncbi:MAG: ThiF family adenylyltransferase [Bacteroidetes bacterium]|nr:ThiF family adenylyltransferase [Bacteroidota bacterium]
MRYARNRIYISEKEQQQLKKYKIFLAGCGIGSVIAECALRLGFENITIADGDNVELSNLNRQNYTDENIGTAKTESIKKRLLQINPDANITTHNLYLTESNIEQLLAGHNVAINALDFQSNAPFVFDELCQKNNMPALHPYNIGWAALLFIILPTGAGLTSICDEYTGFEKKAVGFFLNKMEQNNEQRKWVENVLTVYANETIKQSPPQLSVASWLLGGLCASAMYRLATGKEIKQFPDFYFLSTL